MDIGIRRLWRQRNARKILTCNRCYSADIKEIPLPIPSTLDELSEGNLHLYQVSA